MDMGFLWGLWLETTGARCQMSQSPLPSSSQDGGPDSQDPPCHNEWGKADGEGPTGDAGLPDTHTPLTAALLLPCHTLLQGGERTAPRAGRGQSRAQRQTRQDGREKEPGKR